MNNRIICVGLLLIAVAAIVVVGGFFEQMRTSAEPSPVPIVNCGDPNVRCVFDAGDSWKDMLSLQGRMVNVGNITTDGLSVGGSALSVNRDSVAIGGYRVYYQGFDNRFSIDVSSFEIRSLPSNLTGEKFYLCINSANKVYKSTQPCR